MLCNFAILYAEHVEPCGGVLLGLVFRVLTLPRERKDYQVAFSYDTDHRLTDDGLDLLHWHASEEVSKCFAAARYHRIVLDIVLRHIFLGQIHMVCLQNLSPEIEHELLINREFRI